jgi:hypothetical protein
VLFAFCPLDYGLNKSNADSLFPCFGGNPHAEQPCRVFVASVQRTDRKSDVAPSAAAARKVATASFSVRVPHSKFVRRCSSASVLPNASGESVSERGRMELSKKVACRRLPSSIRESAR